MTELKRITHEIMEDRLSVTSDHQNLLNQLGHDEQWLQEEA